MIIPVNAIDCYMGRLQPGDDLLAALTDLCREKHIHLGRVEAIGAVQRAVLGFYNPEKGKYQLHTLDEPLEITALEGNISLKDGQPFVHAHATLARADGRCLGGHLMEGTVVFACEFILHAYGGGELVRRPDPATGLALWSCPEDPAAP